jgi:hypothetical protein
MSGKRNKHPALSQDQPEATAPSTATSTRRHNSHQLTRDISPPESEPRRSVRATKGQHKALDALDQPIETPKRKGKKGKKGKSEPEEPEEEVIRCVCGATEQDQDEGEPWIACDTCGAWQHNICMGMSKYSEDLPKDYFCEVCKPENHQELLAGLANDEKPWEARRRAYEEERSGEVEKRKKKIPGKRGRKRQSDQKDDLLKSRPSPAPSASGAPAATTPTPTTAPPASTPPASVTSVSAPDPSTPMAASDGQKDPKASAGAKRKVPHEPSEKDLKVIWFPSTLVCHRWYSIFKC